MKRNKSFWLLLVSLIMLLLSVPAGAIDVVVSDSTVESDGVIRFAYINPIYEHLGSDILELQEAAYSAPVEVTVNNIEEASAVLRDQMEQRVANVSITVKNYSGTNMNDDWEKIQEIALQHTGEPTEGDYLKWQYHGAIGSYSSSGLFTYDIYYYTTADQEAEMDAAVEALLTAWDEEYDIYNASDYTKIRTIYDYICDNVTYDYDTLEDDTYRLKYTAYAALINGTAVCQGYANLFYRLALELGVDNRLVAGTANGGGHGWNIVELNDLYYNVDTTWDAPQKEAGYGYIWFLLNQESFERHVRWDEYDTEEFHELYPMSPTNYSYSQSNATHQVTFNYMNGSAVQTKTVYDGEKVVKPAAPVWDGYLFKGWYTDQAFTNAFDWQSGITENITLYARWAADEQFTGLRTELDGKQRYIKNGVLTEITGIITHTDGKQYYVKNGVLTEITGIVTHTNKKQYYVENGVRMKTTGLVKHTNNKWYHVVNGVRQYTNGLVKHTNGKLHYVENGVLTKKTNFMTHTDGKQYYVQKGIVEKFTGLVTHTNNKQYYVKDGVRQKTTGIITCDGQQYYVKDGVRQHITGIVTHTNKKQYYVEDGVRQHTTGIVKHTNGKQYYVEDGVRMKTTGLVKHTNNKWYYVENGVRQNTTGLVLHTNGKLHYVKSGVLDKTFNGKWKHTDGRTYTVVKGVVQK